tara:strand:+ start:977 stop:1771 length:795 start_codon:yes stop_codon:yes gene_type:complete
MKKVKISHEVPFCLLEKSRKFNYYDYCLPHLMDESEEYRNFFYESRKQGRYIIMDNSLHELGEAYNIKRLIHWVKEIIPNEFIVPDVWENYNESIRNAKYWRGIELPKEVTKVAVVQAKSEHEAVLCTKIYKDLGYKKIAYSYGASYYNDVCPHPNKDFGKAMGRYMVINDLVKDGILSSKDRVHLLGTASPIEFGLYKNIECIESIDTSNPVMAGIEQKMYFDLGLPSKPKANMNNYQNVKEEDINVDFIEYNIRKFREINEL